MNKKNNPLKRTIKFLSVCKNPKLVSSIISQAPDNVVKSICNAALNAAQGHVILKKKQKKILAANKKLISQLIQKGDTVSKKKKILIQKGGNLIVPTILSVVLSSLGTKLFH